MNHVLFDLLDSCILVYLDNVLIFSRNYEEHVCEVFARLRDHKLYLKPSKCTFLAPRIDFLGHTLSAAGIEVDINKTKVVAEWPRPESVHDIQVFLGLCNYYRRFIHKYAEIAQPLTDLLRKNVPFVWSQECEAAF